MPEVTPGTMNEMTVAIVIVIVVVGATAAVMLIPQSSSTYHLEAAYLVGERTPVGLSFSGVTDCTLDISFVDNPDLLYAIDVWLYEPLLPSSAFHLTLTDDRDQSGAVSVLFEGVARIKCLQVVLGSGVPYNILVASPCSDMETTIVYTNNMIGTNATLDYSATGSSLDLTFTEDMIFSERGMDVTVGETALADTVYLSVNLVDGVNGRAVLSTPLTIHQNTGWVNRSTFLDQVTYNTNSLNPEPLLNIDIRAAEDVYAWLTD